MLTRKRQAPFFFWKSLPSAGIFLIRGPPTPFSYSDEKRDVDRSSLRFTVRGSLVTLSIR